MNSLMAEHGPILEQTLALRHQLMEILTDEDLGYSPGGDNPTLGALCREMGEVEQAYITSFRTFEQDFGYRGLGSIGLPALLQGLEDRLGRPEPGPGGLPVPAVPAPARL